MFTSGTLSLDVATNDYLVTIIYNVIKSTFNPTILCLLVASNILKWVPKICTKWHQIWKKKIEVINLYKFYRICKFVISLETHIQEKEKRF